MVRRKRTGDASGRCAFDHAGSCAGDGPQPFISTFATSTFAASGLPFRRYIRHRDAISQRPAGLALCCRIHANARDVTDLQRGFNRDFNHQHSGRVIAGMILPLAICGWIAGGNDGARQAVASGAPPPDDFGEFPGLMLRQFGAGLLHPAEIPLLFDILRDICRRAGLTRLPDLYLLHYAGTMNAYALGGPDVRRSP